jgi:hypothetical protein
LINAWAASSHRLGQVILFGKTLQRLPIIEKMRADAEEASFSAPRRCDSFTSEPIKPTQIAAFERLRSTRELANAVEQRRLFDAFGIGICRPLRAGTL